MKAYQEEAFKDIHKVLNEAEAILKHVKKDKNDLLNRNIKEQIDRYRKYYHESRKELLGRKTILSRERNKVALWFSVLLQDLYEKYQSRKGVKAKIKDFETTLYIQYKDTGYPFLRTPSPTLDPDYVDDEKISEGDVSD